MGASTVGSAAGAGSAATGSAGVADTARMSCTKPSLDGRLRGRFRERGTSGSLRLWSATAPSAVGFSAAHSKSGFTKFWNVVPEDSMIARARATASSNSARGARLRRNDS